VKVTIAIGSWSTPLDAEPLGCLITGVDYVGDRVNVGRGDTAAPADQPRPARDPGPDLGR